MNCKEDRPGRTMCRSVCVTLQHVATRLKAKKKKCAESTEKAYSEHDWNLEFGICVKRRNEGQPGTT